MADQTVTSQQADADVRLFPWWLVLLWGIFAVIIGALFLYYPYRSLMASIVFLGVYWFIGGIFTLFAGFMQETDRGWKILIGIISIIAGLVILAYPLYSFLILPAVFMILVGVWALIVGVVKLYQGFARKRCRCRYTWRHQHHLWPSSPRVSLYRSSSYPLYLRRICSGWRDCSHCCILYGTGRTEGRIKPTDSFFCEFNVILMHYECCIGVFPVMRAGAGDGVFDTTGTGKRGRIT